MTERDTRNTQAGWDRDQNDRDRRDRDDFRAPRQPQQWHDESYGSGQFSSDNRARDHDYGGAQFGAGQQGGSHGAYSGAQYGDRQRSWQEDDAHARRSHRLGGDFRDEQHAYGGGYGPGYYDERAGRFGSFTSEDQGGRDYSARRQGPYVGHSSGFGYAYGANDRGFGSDYRSRGYATTGREYAPERGYADDRRGFFSRAGDEVASWFGDEDAARRREADHSGRGPSNYTRSDERIREDANDALTRDWGVDASNVSVRVEKGEVTLDGSVDSRQAKRRAEDAVDRLSGVRHVQNNLRVSDNRNHSGSTWNAGASGTGSSATSTGKTS